MSELPGSAGELGLSGLVALEDPLMAVADDRVSRSNVALEMEGA
jgi:hypothetical protein